MNTKFIILCLLIAGASHAQSGKLKRADNYYDQVAYAEAITIYDQLLNSEVDSPELKSKLADCYYQIGNTKKAAEVYELFINESTSEVEDVYNYAQSLKENGDYAKSDTWMAVFETKRQEDLRAREFAANKSYLTDLNNQKAYFDVKHLDVNTKYTDFGGYPAFNNSVYFVSNRKKRVSVKHFHSFNDQKFLDLYLGKSENNTIENPEFQAKKNKRYHEGPLCFNPDGSRVYFTRNNMSSGKKRRDEKGIQNLKIYTASVNKEGTWEKEKELSINSKDYSVGHPTLSADGNTMYFASDMPGGFGGVDLYKVALKADGTLGEVINLGDKVNTEGQEMFPWISNEGVLFYSSDGLVGLGGLDVFAIIPDQDGEFKKRINLGKPINGPKDDFAFVLNSDNLTGYFSSNRETGKGSDDIYSVKLLRPIKVNLVVEGVVADKRSGELLPGARVQLLDTEGKVISTALANEVGGYQFDIEENFDYKIVAENENYFDNGTNFTTKDLDPTIEVLNENIVLEKDPGLSLYALVTNKKTGAPLDNVTVTILDNMTGVEESFNTPPSGDYLRPLIDKKLDDRGSYNISLSKEGFIPKTITYNKLFDREGQYDVHLEADLSMDEVVEDLRDLVQINPINFDLGKWNIRDDAKKELDKIVEVMNKYPEMVVELGSHTDCRASKSFNMRLSDKRAKSSASYIKSKITNPDRIQGKGYGESRLLNGCECEGSVKSDCSEEEHEKNRRTEFKVISIGQDKVKVINNSDDSFDD